ncbi:MAG: endonuclease [Actinomycetota bacterium]|nr:endonuclease [Actinomycetota bacterium]
MSTTDTVYLLHFERRYRHAGHYVGSTSDLDARLAAHRAGRGARLVEVIVAAGIDFTLARTWPGGRQLERRIKRQKASPRLCPLCREAARPGAAVPR